MIDVSNEIFTAVAKNLREAYKGVRVIGEYVATPPSFPCVTLDEIGNVPAHLDSAAHNKYAEVTYRVQVFSNKNGGKRSEAREIYNRVDRELQKLGLFGVTYSTLPDVYNSEIYQITATHRGVVSENGTVYRG